MKILIAYDGSEWAEAAIDDLRMAGLPEQVEAVVISVADVWMPPPSTYEVVEEAFAKSPDADSDKSSGRARRAVEKMQVVADGGASRVLSIFPDWEVRAEACSGSPSWEIVKKADEWKPDLVVVGSHGRSAIGRLFLGSVSQKVVNEARSSVRVARRPRSEQSGPVRTLIGTDGSAGAEAAVDAVAARRWPAGSEARIVAALDLMIVPPFESVVEFDEDDRAWVGKVVEASAEKLRAAGLVVSSVIETFDPKRLITEEAERWGADSIFVGARGLRRIERFLIGSVSAAVAARAHCSVEIVHN
jgi:nucleotide-binding universal stress UspA family protein